MQNSPPQSNLHTKVTRKDKLIPFVPQAVPTKDKLMSCILENKIMPSIVKD